VRGDERLSAVGRLDVYNSMYFFRLLEDVLAADYPTVAAVLGHRFSAMVGEYLQACPPNHPSARNASARLPTFLQTWTAESAAPAWLPALAQLEWARVDVFDEADDEVITFAHLQEVTPDALPTMPLMAIKAHRLVDAPVELAPVWRAVAAAEPIAEPVPQACTFLVWREDGRVYHRTIDADEAPLLRMLAEGTTLADLCDRLGDGTGDAWTAAQRAAQLLSRWADDLLLTRG